MKIFFVHGTENQENIGCRLTSGGLEMLFSHHELDHFRAESIFKLKQILTSSRRLKPILETLKLISQAHFDFIKRYIMRNKKNLLDSIRVSDAVVINGEGSIHHGQLTGIILLAIASIAKASSKPVHVVNATFQALTPPELAVLRSVDKIVVREVFSRNYLLSHGIKSLLGSDAAWFFLSRKWPELLLRRNKAYDCGQIIITGGVNLKSAWPGISIFNLIKDSDKCDYLYIDKSDTANLLFLQNKITLNKKLLGSEILVDPSLLLNYSFMISGRHHMTILAMFLGLPVYIIPGNTYKIESTVFSIKNKYLKNNIMLTRQDIQKTVRRSEINQSL